MKTFWKILACIIGVGILVGLGLIGFQNKDFLKTYFDTKQKKIELRTEESVDSLLRVIEERDCQIEALDSIIKSNDSLCGVKVGIKDTEIDSIIKYYENDKDKLLNVINHQNQMIDKLNTLLGGNAYE